LVERKTIADGERFEEIFQKQAAIPDS